MSRDRPRVVPLVRSWTETLLLAGVDVGGRSRFCVHPSHLVPDVPVVGGTKDVRWERVAAVQPDLILLDREENAFRPAVRQDEFWNMSGVHKPFQRSIPLVTGLACASPAPSPSGRARS